MVQFVIVFKSVVGQSMVARSAVRRSVVVPVAVYALAHLQRFDLLDLFHCCYIAVAGRADASRSNCHAARAVGDCLGMVCEISDVRFMSKSDMVRHPVHTFPIDRMGSSPMIPAAIRTCVSGALSSPPITW